VSFFMFIFVDLKFEDSFVGSRFVGFFLFYFFFFNLDHHHLRLAFLKIPLGHPRSNYCSLSAALFRKKSRFSLRAFFSFH